MQNSELCFGLCPRNRIGPGRAGPGFSFTGPGRAGPMFLCSLAGRAGPKFFGPGRAGLDIFGPCRTLVWNDLPSELKNSDISRQGFKSSLKSWLFERPL